MNKFEKCCCVFYIVIIAIFVLNGPIKCMVHDNGYPKAAINFAYQDMSDKLNVTFIEKHTYSDGYFSIVFFVRDSDNTDYRMQWSKDYYNMELNKSYDIRYLKYNNENINDKIWEIKMNRSMEIL